MRFITHPRIYIVTYIIASSGSLPSSRTRRRIVGSHVHSPPVPVDDSLSDLRRALSLLGLLVGVDGFHPARGADRGMGADVAIEQTLVTVFVVAHAVARLLVQDFLDLGRQCVDVLVHGVRELLGVLRLRESALRKVLVVCGNAGRVAVRNILLWPRPSRRHRGHGQPHRREKYCLASEVVFSHLRLLEKVKSRKLKVESQDWPILLSTLNFRLSTAPPPVLS